MYTLLQTLLHQSCLHVCHCNCTYFVTIPTKSIEKTIFRGRKQFIIVLLVDYQPDCQVEGIEEFVHIYTLVDYMPPHKVGEIRTDILDCIQEPLTNTVC